MCLSTPTLREQLKQVACFVLTNRSSTYIHGLLQGPHLKPQSAGGESPLIILAAEPGLLQLQFLFRYAANPMPQGPGLVPLCAAAEGGVEQRRNIDTSFLLLLVGFLNAGA